MRAKSYCLTLLVILFFLVFGAVALNWIVDPLDIYRVVRQEGVNEFKPKLSSYSRLAKPIRIENGDYERLAFGSSRTEIGIPVYGSAWDAKGETAMNAAVSGADMQAVSTLFHHALETTNVRDVVIGLDFFMFNANGQTSYSYPQVIAGEDDRLRKLKGMQLTLFSPGITQASFYTLRKQKPKYDKYLITGQMNNERETNKAIDDGYENVFSKFEQGFMRSTWTACRDNLYSYDNGRVNTLQLLEAMLKRAADNEVSVSLYVAPIHARLLEALDATGLWPAYEQWKRDITMVVDKVQSEPSGQAVALWDFSGYNEYSSEALPEQSGQAMTWYIDSSHFSDALGKQMLDQMYTKEDSGFGIQLRLSTIEKHLVDIRYQQQAYRETHQQQRDYFSEQARHFLNLREKNGKSCEGTPSVENSSA